MHWPHLQVFMDSNDADGLIAATVRYGDASRGGDPQLWNDVLEHFIAQVGRRAWRQAEGVCVSQLWVAQCGMSFWGTTLHS